MKDLDKETIDSLSPWPSESLKHDFANGPASGD
jgi:hypothetical protein